jgi:hypothetical protein
MSKKRKLESEENSFLLEPQAFEEIAEIQLERLRMISRERLLTFEETRIFDILTKNLLLSKGKATDIVGSAKKLIDEADTKQLIEIARSEPEQTKKASLDVVDEDGSSK